MRASVAFNLEPVQVVSLIERVGVRRRVARDADAEIVAVFLFDIADQVVGVLKQIGQRVIGRRVLVWSGRVTTEREDVLDAK